MFDDVYRVAKKPLKNWAKAQKLPASRAESEYFRILRSLTEEWITSDSGLSPAARQSNIQKLLKLDDAGRIAGIKAALQSSVNGPIGIIPDYQNGWAWLFEGSDSLTPSILWQAYFSQHEEVSRQAESALMSEARSAPSLFHWLHDGGISLSQQIVNEWAGLEPTAQLRLWGHTGATINLESYDLSGAPWLRLLSQPPASSSKDWKVITAAPEYIVAQFLALAPATARLTAVEALLKSPKTRRMLADLFNNHRYPLPPVDAGPEIALGLSQMAETSSIFDQMAPALLTYASGSYPWPSWFRIRCEAACCMNWNKSPFKSHIGQWSELSLGDFPASARHELFRSAKSPAERLRYNDRWLKWYRAAPAEAWQWSREIYWKELSDAPPTFETLSVLLQANSAPMSIPAVVDVNPVVSLAILSHVDLPQDPEGLDRYMPVSSLLESLRGVQKNLDSWRTSLVASLIRHGVANPDDIGTDVLIRVRQSLSDELQDARLNFHTSMHHCLSQLSGLANKRQVLAPLVDEIIALSRVQALGYPIPDLEATEDPAALSVDVRLLAIARDEFTTHENRAIASILSPLEKMFDLKLVGLMNEVQTCLTLLDLDWIADNPGDDDFDPVRHELVGATPEAHLKIRLQSPGLIRRSDVLIKAWGEPAGPRGNNS